MVTLARFTSPYLKKDEIKRRILDFLNKTKKFNEEILLQGLKIYSKIRN